MNYNYNQVKIKVIDFDSTASREFIEKSTNEVLNEIGKKGNEIYNVQNVYMPNLCKFRVTITYREAVS